MVSDLDKPKCRGNREKVVGAFQRPLLEGWERKGILNIYYRAPRNGRCFHNLNEIDIYLSETNSRLRIDCFDLNNDIEISSVSREIQSGAYVSNQNV